MNALTTLTTIKSLMNPEKINNCVGGTLSIEEKGKQATLKSIRIDSIGANSFAIKYDECGFPNKALFAPTAPVHRACDCIAFCIVDGTPYILCCELKSDEPTKEEVAQQFRNAHCFLDYLSTILEVYYPSCDSIRNWSRRYFVFHGQRQGVIKKRKSRDGYNNDKPENAQFIPAHSGQANFVRQLLGKPL